MPARWKVMATTRSTNTIPYPSSTTSATSKVSTSPASTAAAVAPAVSPVHGAVARLVIAAFPVPTGVVKHWIVGGLAWETSVVIRVSVSAGALRRTSRVASVGGRGSNL